MNLYERIAKCSSFTELYEVLKEIGIVQGSRDRYYTYEQNVERIESIRHGYPINVVTRSLGIRAKVAELLHYR